MITQIIAEIEVGVSNPIARTLIFRMKRGGGETAPALTVQVSYNGEVSTLQLTPEDSQAVQRWMTVNSALLQNS